MNLDFTLSKYTQICETIKRCACPIMTISQFLEAGQPEEFVVILRHDVDRDVRRTIEMANVEADFDINATYYFRKIRSVFKKDQIKQLSQLGHEVGYHYEVLTKARGNNEKALRLFKQELAEFREVVPVETISMHGSPLTPWNNLDMWQVYDFDDFGLLGEAYLSIDYSNVYYFTDTGRSWYPGRYNIRDHAHSKETVEKIVASDDLINFLNNRPDSPVIINTHPNRWAKNVVNWLVSAASDWGINQVKWGISVIRH